MLTSAAAALRLRASPRANARLAAGTALLVSGAAASSRAGTASSGEEPRDDTGSLARGPRVVVSPPQPRQSLADPAEAPSGMLERITELAQVGTVRMIIWGSVSVCSCAGPRGWHWVAPSARPPSPPPPLPSAPLQNVLRPREARPHAYHYAEDSARAVMAEQLESGRGKPTVEEMWVAASTCTSTTCLHGLLACALLVGRQRR